MNRSAVKNNPKNLSHPVDIDLELWRDFQDGLSALIEVPLTLYDESAEVIVESGRVNSVCKRVKLDLKGRSLCNDFYAEVVAEAVSTRQSHIYKCHTNQYLFTVPVLLSCGAVLVIVGGRVYLEGMDGLSSVDGTVKKELFEGVAAFGFSLDTIERMKKGLKSIPKNGILSLPGIVENMAVPFLKGLGKFQEAAVNRRAEAATPVAPVSDLSSDVSGDSGVSDASSEAQRQESKTRTGFRALEEVYKSIAPVLDRELLYKTILDKTTELIGAERGSLMMLDKKKEYLSIKAAKGIDSDLHKGIKVKIGTGISGAIAAKGVPVMVADIEEEVPRHRRVSKYKTGSFLSIPLKLDDRVIGVLNVSDKITGAAFSEDDLSLLLSLANYATIALERGTYYTMSEEFKLISMTDPLTGLFNRRYFRERLFEEVERVKRHSGCFATFVIDIDNFKAFNDTYGHVAGDEMLKSVSRAIRGAVRGMDIVARYGGEEFNVLLPHTTKQESWVIAERIRESVEALNPESTAINELPTISVGIAEFPVDAKSIDELINNADRAMYTAKRMGKNRVVFYER
ncbi:MAG: diguanylate cyclase [Proteobacteria bacterium]|nr:diguanylate cyclase [Pseudomonadota bacterium]